MASDNVEILKKTLVDNGYSLTRARLAVFELLNNNEPQTISQILAKANGLVDRVSVYRNIELFEKLGIVRRIYLGWKYKLELSDKFFAHHHHLTALIAVRQLILKMKSILIVLLKKYLRRMGSFQEGISLKLKACALNARLNNNSFRTEYSFNLS